MKHIDSANNPLLKTLRRLAHPRKRTPQFLLEGRKLVDAAIDSGIEIDAIVVSSAYPETNLANVDSVEIVVVQDALFRQISTLESPEGILAIATRPRSPSPVSGLVAVASGIQDPGNLGAIARVVEASGANGLVVLKGSADPFGPKALRGSMGSLLRVPVCETADMSPLHAFSKAAIVPRSGDDFRTVSFKAPLALVFGGESAGLDDATLSQCGARISIPMHGNVESLNVATAAALILYEATRHE
jgi:TrmH family RNA methyltransferase